MQYFTLAMAIKEHHPHLLIQTSAVSHLKTDVLPTQMQPKRKGLGDLHHNMLNVLDAVMVFFALFQALTCCHQILLYCQCEIILSMNLVLFCPLLSLKRVKSDLLLIRQKKPCIFSLFQLICFQGRRTFVGIILILMTNIYQNQRILYYSLKRQRT